MAVNKLIAVGLFSEMKMGSDGVLEEMHDQVPGQNQ